MNKKLRIEKLSSPTTRNLASASCQKFIERNQTFNQGYIRALNTYYLLFFYWPEAAQYLMSQFQDEMGGEATVVVT